MCKEAADTSQVITVTSFILPRKVEENFTEEVEFRFGASLQRTRSFKCPGLPCRQLPVVWPLELSG